MNSIMNQSITMEDGILAKVWVVLMSTRLELSIFLLAVAAHFLLFGNASPRKQIPKKGADGPWASKGLPLGFASRAELEAAAATAASAGNHREVLRCWTAAKKLEDAVRMPLSSLVDAMQRAKKDTQFIARELHTAFSRQAGYDMYAINELLDFVGKRPDTELLQQILALLPGAGLELDARSYEILMGTFFNARNFDEVQRLVLQMQVKDVQMTTRASITMLKTALKTNNFDKALSQFRQLKSMLTGPALSGPSTAPRQLIQQLVEISCKEHQLERFLPELGSIPLTMEAVHLMLGEALHLKNTTNLLEQVQDLAQAQNLAFTEATYSLLIKGCERDMARVEELLQKAREGGCKLGGELCLAVLGACALSHSTQLADRLYEQLREDAQPAVLVAFLRFYFQMECYEKVCDIYEKDAAPTSAKASQEGRALCDARLEKNIMTAASRIGRTGLAQSFLEKQPSDIARHVTMIRNCAAERNLAGVMSIFDSLRASGAELNAVVYNTVLDACVECKQLQTAESWMSKMKSEGMVDVVSYNTLIKAHLQAGAFSQARELMEEMRTAGMQPNRVTYNELVNAMVTSGPQAEGKQVWDVLKQMQKCNMKPNHIACSILLKNLNSKSSESDISQTMSLINGMDEPLDEVLLSSVVEACVRIGKPDFLNNQLRQLMQNNNHLVSGSHTFGSLIKAYGHAHDMPAVWSCWKEMRSRHIKPTSITVGCMVEAVVSNGDPASALDLIHQLAEDEQCKDVLNSVIYCSVLKGFTREKNLDRVKLVYEEMQKRKIDPSIVTFNTILDCYARCCRMEDVAEILLAMKQAGIKANLVTYSTMLKGHCQSGNLRAGFDLVQEMRTVAGIKPDEIMYNSLLDGCAQNNLPDEGLKVLQEMQADNVKPSNFTLSVLVKLMSRARRLDGAFQMVADLSRKYGLRPNSHVYANLVQACCYAKQLQRALDTLEEMVEKSVQPDARTYTFLIRSSLQQGQVKVADGLLRAALGLSGALPFLAKRTSVAVCQALPDSMLSEALAAMSLTNTPGVAAALLHHAKEQKPHLWVDADVQRRVVTGTLFKGHQVQSSGKGYPSRQPGTGKGKGKGFASRS
ncbi:unnamed protein product [Polarella glacialis]|uniref:PROP1-like PPR domain-containing protein n=1 Tax=Polarella glacialis TaxID=89957 RepID=A0A813KPI5_POLGL|nr:unnamed protein product [Polarella glacialis]